MYKCGNNEVIFDHVLDVKNKNCSKLNMVGELNNLDCSQDTFTIKRWSIDKREKGKKQNIYFNSTTYYIKEYIPGSNKWDIKLLQEVEVNAGKMNVYNLNEHLAFFNTKLIIKNEIGLKDPNLLIKRFETYPTDSVGEFSIDISILFDLMDKSTHVKGFQIGKNKYEYSLNDWSTKTNFSDNETQWTFYLSHPFHTLEETPSNFHQWMRERLYWKNRGYKSHDLPKPSREKFVAYTYSHYMISTYKNLTNIPLDSFYFTTTIDHYLGDIIVGSAFPDHNAYRELKYSYSNYTEFKN